MHILYYCLDISSYFDVQLSYLTIVYTYINFTIMVSFNSFIYVKIIAVKYHDH